MCICQICMKNINNSDTVKYLRGFCALRPPPLLSPLSLVLIGWLSLIPTLHFPYLAPDWLQRCAVTQARSHFYRRWFPCQRHEEREAQELPSGEKRQRHPSALPNPSKARSARREDLTAVRQASDFLFAMDSPRSRRNRTPKQ